MELPTAYIPIDRRHAIAEGISLPERTTGAALFADISGFTPLTEALERELGPKRGAEELTIHLNRVYTALIAEVHRLGGSVIGFSGDAITCWFDGDDSRRATVCGLAMQQAMAQFAQVKTASGGIVSLGMKAAVAAGDVRRMVVGDPAYVLVDTMAGKTLENLAAAEKYAERGDVVLDPAAAAALEGYLEVTEWHSSEKYPDRFAVVTRLNLEVPDMPWPELAADAISREQQSTWLLPAVDRRLASGQGAFLAELRPAAALFVRFSGINFDEDPEAPQKLDLFIRGVEEILARYEGSLLQLTIGDKGSYLYAAFGAPVAHEDDAIRAGASALELQAFAARLDYLDEPQMGITYGRMRTGAYGSQSRRTYGVLGDNVNLSARLMSAAQPGQIFVSERARQDMGALFDWQQMDNIMVKGKSEPVSLSALKGYATDRLGTTHLPKYALPMVGRQAEHALISEKLALTAQGRGQIVGISAEAGLGKSRLAAEMMSKGSAELNFLAYAGECQSYGSNRSYLVWQDIWRNIFMLDASTSMAQQIEHLRGTLKQINPKMVKRMPLLGSMLNLAIPDNELTASLTAKLRKSALESMLVDCLRYRSQQQPLIIMLDDCHWIDELSHDLLEVIARAIYNLPVMLLALYRQPDGSGQGVLRLSQFSYFSEIKLTDFTVDEARQLIALKLVKYFGDQVEAPEAFVTEISKRSAGNPFYIEEIINYLNTLGVDPHDTKALQSVDLPASIYSLILSRIDQLTEKQQSTIRIASVIGRLFRAATIWGGFPDLGESEQINHDLQALAAADLTPMDAPEPESTYIFKHVLTQEIAYESLLYATRAMLHNQIGLYLESTLAGSLDRQVTLLAHHFEHSDNEEKKREYLLKAGDLSQSEYANSAAIDYYRKALPLLPEPEQARVKLKIGKVYDTIGNFSEAEELFRQALAMAEAQGDPSLQASCQIGIGEIHRKQSKYAESGQMFELARQVCTASNDLSGLAKSLVCSGSLALYQGDYESANNYYTQSLAIRRQLNQRADEANLLNNMAIVAANQGAFDEASAIFMQSLEIRRQLEDRWHIANSLSNLGQLAQLQGKYEEAREFLEEAVAIHQETGDKWMMGNAINNLANVYRDQQIFDRALQLYQESTTLNHDMGDKWALAHLLEDIGSLVAMQGEARRALQLSGAASRVRQQIGAPLSPADQNKLDQKLVKARETLGDDAPQVWQVGLSMELEEAIEIALSIV